MSVQLRTGVYLEEGVMKRNYEGATTAIHILTRREMLILMGETAAATLVGCGHGPSGRYTRTTVAGCLVSPEQTEGPYFGTKSSTVQTSVKTLRTIQ